MEVLGRIHHGKIDLSASGDGTLLAGVTDKRIYVTSYVLVGDAAVTAKFKSGSTDITGPMSFAPNGGVSANFNMDGHFATEPGEPLVLNSNANEIIGGHFSCRIGP